MEAGFVHCLLPDEELKQSVQKYFLFWLILERFHYIQNEVHYVRLILLADT